MTWVICELAHTGQRIAVNMRLVKRLLDKGEHTVITYHDGTTDTITGSMDAMMLNAGTVVGQDDPIMGIRVT